MKATRPQRIIVEGDEVRYLGLVAHIVSVNDVNATATIKVARDSRVSNKKPIEVNICDLAIFR